MKCSKKLLALLLTVLMICGISTVAVYTADAGEDDTAAPTDSNSTTFADVPADAWYADVVKWCCENGLIDSMTDTNFSPRPCLKKVAEWSK